MDCGPRTPKPYAFIWTLHPGPEGKICFHVESDGGDDGHGDGGELAPGRPVWRMHNLLEHLFALPTASLSAPEAKDLNRDTLQSYP